MAGEKAVRRLKVQESGEAERGGGPPVTAMGWVMKRGVLTSEFQIASCFNGTKETVLFQASFSRMNDPFVKWTLSSQSRLFLIHQHCLKKVLFAVKTEQRSLYF